MLTTYRIPITKMASDEEVMDWDCLEALDIPLLASCLRYVRKHGILPPRFVSRGTSNARLSDKIDGAVADLLRSTIAHRLVQARRSLNLKQPLRLVFMEGFMLYAPPWTESHPLRAIEEQLDARLFLPVTRSRMKERRGNRDDYLVRTTDTSFMSHDKDSLTDREKRREDDPSTLQDDQWQANMKIWHDPPNFVDEVVWPNYVANHLWIFAPDHVDLSNASTSSMSKMEMVDLVGEGSYTRKDTGVTVAPGNGEASVVELLEWAVDEVLKIIEAGK